MKAKCHLNLKAFLSQVKSGLFKDIGRLLAYSNFSREEWDAIR